MNILKRLGLKKSDVSCINMSVELIDPTRFIKGKATTDYWTIAQSKLAEFCGRTCYNSTNNMKEDSYKNFIKNLCDNKHLSVLEHFEVILRGDLKDKDQKKLYFFYKHIQDDPGFKLLSPVRVFSSEGQTDFYIVTNYRYYLSSDLKNTWETKDFINPQVDMSESDKTNYYLTYRRVTISADIPISLSRELNRHRCLSVSERSTRWCGISTSEDINSKNYPFVINNLHKLDSKKSENIITKAYRKAFDSYKVLRTKCKIGNDTSREVLPLGLMSKVCYTAFKDQWYDVWIKRTVQNAHYNAREFASMLNHILIVDCHEIAIPEIQLLRDKHPEMFKDSKEQTKIKDGQ